MNIYTFNIGDREVDVKANNQFEAEEKVAHYEFPVITHFNGKSVLIEYKKSA